MRRLIADDGKFISAVSILGIVILVVAGLVVLAFIPSARDGVIPAITVGVTAIAAYRPGAPVPVVPLATPMVGLPVQAPVGMPAAPDPIAPLPTVQPVEPVAVPSSKK